MSTDYYMLCKRYRVYISIGQGMGGMDTFYSGEEETMRGLGQFLDAFRYQDLVVLHGEYMFEEYKGAVEYKALPQEEWDSMFRVFSASMMWHRTQSYRFLYRYLCNVSKSQGGKLAGHSWALLKSALKAKAIAINKGDFMERMALLKGLPPPCWSGP